MGDEMKKALQEKEQQQEASTAEESSGSVEFTQEQQEHVNRLVAQAKSKAKDEAKKDREEAIKEALAKEKDYAKLSEKERERQEFEDELEQFRHEKAEFKRQKLVNDIKQDLLDKELPGEFAELLAESGDAETALEYAGRLNDIFKEAVAKEVKRQFKQQTPGVGVVKQSSGGVGERLASRKGKQSVEIWGNK